MSEVSSNPSLAVNTSQAESSNGRRIDWFRILPFILLHVACVCVLFVGVSWFAVGLAVFMYVARMFFVTAFYHRYFSHRSFKTARLTQFILAWLGCTAAQRGPMWWAAHHRKHHIYSDQDPDVHSPTIRGLLWSHMGWFLTRENFHTDLTMVRDWKRYPEIRFLNRFDWLPVVILGTGIFLLGEVVGRSFPSLETNGWQALVWGFVVSTIVMYHATYTINSLAHRFGRKRFDTKDDSRNNWFLAILTLGEGWHNNHHHYPASVRQGFYWWEVDITWYVLWVMSKLGLIWDLRPVPRHALNRNRISKKPPGGAP